MKLSQKGLDLICSFEGYLVKQKDGSCKSYRCPAGVWTCGWGCTEGVGPNTHWTKKEAQERYQAELAKFEAAVDRLVKVELNQNQFDALVSFAYNCGEGALGKSSLLRKLNKGDYAGACAEFAKWNKGGGRVLRGLTRRRAAEAALFSTRVPQETDDEAVPTEGVMPQKIDAPSREWVAPAVALGGSSAAGAGATQIPAPPSLEAASAWQTAGDNVMNMGTWAISNPLMMMGIVTVIAGWIWWPHIVGLVRKPQEAAA